MDDREPPDADNGRDSPVALNDPYPDWGFNSVDPDIATVPGAVDADGTSFPYDRFGRVDAGGTVSVDAYTPDVFGHWLAIADSDENTLRSQEVFGSNGGTEFDLSGGGDGDRLDAGAYVVVNANGELDPRALQPLCVQAYSATIQTVTENPVPEVTVTVDAVETDPPAVGTLGVVLWNDSNDAFVELSETDGTFEGDLSGVDPGTYSLHALVTDDTTAERLVGLSGTETAEVVAQTDLTFEVDGEEGSVDIDDGETVPYTATAAYEDGSTEDVTDDVAVAVTDGDPGAVDIDESTAEVTGTEPGTVTLEVDTGGFADTVDVSVEPVLTDVAFAIDGQYNAVTVDEGTTAPYAATAAFSDGTEQDVTAEADVTSADTGVVSVDQGAHEVTGEAPGEGVTVTAGYQGEADTVDVTVDGPQQVGLLFQVDGQSGSVNIEDGETVPYAATAEYEDGSTEDVTDGVAVAVTSGDPAVVTIDDTAAAVTGAEPGTVTLEADHNGFADTVELSVEAVLEGLLFAIDGQSDTVTVSIGDSVPYTATAAFSDGTEQDVTAEADVTSADTGVVSVDQGAHEVTGEAPGEGVTVTADYQTETDGVAVTVPDDDGTDVTVPSESIPPGGEASLEIVGSNATTLSVEEVWTDWEVTPADPDGAETTDNVSSAGQFELAWESQQSSIAPTIAVAPPDRYVGGEFELAVTVTGPDGSTATDSAVLTIDGDSP